MGDDGFIRAILEAPEDDGPRLVYADWLDEHGQPERAEFIRIECEQVVIHRDPECAPNRWDNPRFWELEDRGRELCKRHAAGWFGPLLRKFGREMSTRRGFPWQLALSARRFLEQGEAIFRAAPTIEDVMIVRLGRNMQDLAQCPALAHVRRLEFFETPFRSPEAECLAASPYLENLRKLHIGFTDTQIGPRGAMALAGAKTLRQLEHLDLHNHAVYDEGAAALLRSPRLATLTQLHLGNNGLTDQAALDLAAADHLSLRSLNLMWNHLTPRGVAALAGAGHLASLEYLCLGWNAVNHAGAVALVEGKSVAHLHELMLWECGLDDAAVSVVFEGAPRSLIDLNVSRNVVDEGAARALAGNRSLKKLESLSAVRCQMEEQAAALLGQAMLPKLRILDASNNPLGPDGVRALLTGPLVGPIRHLDLETVGLGDLGAEVVAGSPTVAKIAWLELPENQICDRGALALAESAHLEAVLALNLRGNPLGKKARAALKRRFGERVKF
jgi:uncharacterized protein (TIGR02996 family)